MIEGAWTGEGGQGWVFIPPEKSLIVLRPSDQWSEDEVREAAQGLGRQNNADVLVLPADADITVLPEDVMRRLGWCKCGPVEVAP